MATITKRKRVDGSIAYTAQIRMRRGGVIVHTESETFDRLNLAKEWVGRREAELRLPGALDRVRSRGVTVGDLITRYCTEVQARAAFGRTKREHLAQMLRMDLAEVSASMLDTKRIMAHFRSRAATAAAATVNNDAVWLRVVMRYAAHVLGMPVPLDAVEAAIAQAKGEGLIGKSRRRARRVSDAEIDLICEYLGRSGRWSSYPMADIIRFAVTSARRQAEITRILWADVDAESRTVLVRDVKHPRLKAGNHRRCKLPRAAWEIMARQPRGDGELRVFPYDAKTVSVYFTRAVSALELSDLHFHDLRHEATSRLFEAGHSIQEVQLITLHDSWAELARYTHLRAEDVPDR